MRVSPSVKMLTSNVALRPREAVAARSRAFPSVSALTRRRRHAHVVKPVFFKLGKKKRSSWKKKRKIRKVYKIALGRARERRNE
jgi:hypothetical protein